MRDFDAVDRRLRDVLREHVPPLVVVADGPVSYTVHVDRPDIAEPQRYFGGVRKGKSYVSFYLMPVYVFPRLLDDITPALRKRMQGKSCFNFTSVDEALVRELVGLTARGLEKYREMKPFTR